MISDSTNKCANCGKEFPFYEKVCPYCNTEHIVQLKRHAFITFWLWFSCIINVVTMLPLIGFITYGEYILVSSVTLATIIASIAGLIMLIKWRKSGFYLIVISNIIGLIPNIAFAGLSFSPMLIAQSTFRLLILYAILNIKKNDIPYWKAMDMR